MPRAIGQLPTSSPVWDFYSVLCIVTTHWHSPVKHLSNSTCVLQYCYIFQIFHVYNSLLIALYWVLVSKIIHIYFSIIISEATQSKHLVDPRDSRSYWTIYRKSHTTTGLKRQLPTSTAILSSPNCTYTYNIYFASHFSCIYGNLVFVSFWLSFAHVCQWRCFIIFWFPLKYLWKWKIQLLLHDYLFVQWLWNVWLLYLCIIITCKAFFLYKLSYVHFQIYWYLFTFVFFFLYNIIKLFSNVWSPWLKLNSSIILKLL